MERLIQTEVKQVLADEILFGKLQQGGRVDIDYVDDELTFTYTPLAASDEEPVETAEIVE